MTTSSSEAMAAMAAAPASAAAAAAAAPASPRIPPELRALYLESNAGGPPPVAIGFDASISVDATAASSRRHKRQRSRHQRPRSTPPPSGKHRKSSSGGEGLPRVVTMTAADAAAAGIRERQLQLALEGCRVQDGGTLASKPPSAPSAAPSSPQEYLDAILRERGYATEYDAPHHAERCKATPTDLQQASYHVHLIGLVRREDGADAFCSILSSGLVAPNPCNRFGESLLHAVCRRGRRDLLQSMLAAGASVQDRDDFGRTPLHDACWAAGAPPFGVIRDLLDRDAALVAKRDLRGARPLEYAPRPQGAVWAAFLDSVKDTYWPWRRGDSQPPAPLPSMAPPPVPRMSRAAACRIAILVASGEVSPEDGRRMAEEKAEEGVLLVGESGSELSSPAASSTAAWAQPSSSDGDDDDSHTSDRSEDSGPDESDDDDEDDTSLCAADSDAEGLVLAPVFNVA